MRQLHANSNDGQNEEDGEAMHGWFVSVTLGLFLNKNRDYPLQSLSDSPMGYFLTRVVVYAPLMGVVFGVPGLVYWISNLKRWR